MGVLYDVAIEGKDLKTEKPPETVGVYAISNTLAICVHEIDYMDDRVLSLLAAAQDEKPTEITD